MVDTSCVDDAATCPNNSGYPRNGYSASNSTTAEPMGTYASIEYLGGDTTGPGIEDIFTVGAAPNATTWTQSFMAANRSSWSNIPCDGFLGLAFTTIADANTTTLVETLMRDGRLDEPRFGLYYGADLNDTGSGPGAGVLSLGGSHEDTYVDGAMEWAPLQAAGENAQLWRVNMAYMVGSRPAAPASGNATATTTAAAAAPNVNSTVTLSGAWGVFDTGAGRITVPEAYVESIYASIGMNWTAIITGGHVPLCAEFTDDWSVSFSFGDGYSPATVTLTGSQLAHPGFGPGGDEYCWPPFDSGESSGLFLFGGQFLQLFYSVWDFGGFEPAEYAAQIGFGALKEEFRA